nr:MAG TPA: hypothetical protein [Crassvirales sp.]DAW82075.1 MAG TPA: hypothetical protein [Crassvirales sp.]
MVWSFSFCASTACLLASTAAGSAISLHLPVVASTELEDWKT